MPVSQVDPSPSSSPSSAPPEGYTVRSGDTLYAIAQAHGVSLQALESANPQILHPDLIFRGQHLNIPGDGHDGGEPKAAATPKEVTVKTGDTLAGIASKFGVDWRTMAQVNHLSNPDLIRPGERLEVPGHGHDRGGGDVAPAQGASGSSAAGGAGGHAYDIAKSYLGRNASSLKTDTHDQLHMDPGVSSQECCANFVSAVLVQAGQLPASKHTDSVQQLKTTLESRGWSRVDAAHARPGDVVIMQRGISHTEMVAPGGRMIGSNNTNSDGSQKVGYSSLAYAAQHGGIILRAPGGGAAPAPRPAPAADDAGAATPATLAGRTQAAVTYFQGQGWTHAQAAGIVGNLLGENGQLNPHQHEIRAGGGDGPGRGLAQWTDPSRLAAFRAYFNGRGPDQTSFREQLGYMQHELMTTERRAASDIRAATTPAQAAAGAVEAERPANAEAAARVRGGYAEQVFRDTH